MKKLILIAFFTSALVACTKDDFTWNVKKRACYIQFYDSSEDFFSTVQIANMTNNTVGTDPNNYFEEKTISLKRGQSYELHTVFQTTSNLITAYAYFDWNADGDFSDSNESILISNSAANNDNYTSITVPADAKRKASNVRILLKTGSNTASDPCEEYNSYGEVEDYPLEIE